MVQGLVWKYWSQISAFTKTQREENVRPVCARNLEEPGNWSRLASTETPNSCG